MRKLFRRTDITVIAVALILSFLLFIPGLFNDDNLIAQIYVEGKEIVEINLNDVSEAYTFSPKSGTVISVKKGAICFCEASCKDEICIESGWLTSKGHTAACLPERIVITIKGADKTDMMTY